MPKALKNSEYYIQILAKGGPKRRKALLNHATHQEEIFPSVIIISRNVPGIARRC